MKKVLNYQITKENEHLKIENFLRGKGFSRHIISHLKKTPNGICQNGEWAYVNQPLNSGDTLTVTLIEDESSPHIVPIPMDLHIVYEDEDLMVINKPADMPIHPSINNYENTLANGIAHYFQSQGIPFVYRCINRLDRDTTGLLIIAKHMLSAALLSKMVSMRTISREYLAITEGQTPMADTINAPIARMSDSLIERQVDFACGETAITHYKTVRHIGSFSLVSLKLETGRTHQIRVHMKYLGFPLIGDTLYNPDSLYNKKMQRQALHSHRLHFYHPLTQKEMSFSCPLPTDMDAFIKSL